MTTAACLPEIVGDNRYQPPPRSGGLGVWYETKKLNPVKGEETDFLVTSPLLSSPAVPSKNTLLPNLQNLVYSMPTDSLKDIASEKNGFPSRNSLLMKHPHARMRSTYRDAHIYIFPRWVADLAIKNRSMENIGEDIVGWWAKMGWQRNLFDKLGMSEVLGSKADEKDPYQRNVSEYLVPPLPRTTIQTSTNDGNWRGLGSQAETSQIPPLLAYLHPPNTTLPLIRRVDTSQLLLQVSLQLAKLPTPDENPTFVSPFAPAKKIAYPEGVKPRTTITQKDSLVGENVLVEEKTAIRESVVGANCHIKEGAKLMQCLLMDGVIIGKNCKLTRCIVGKRADIGEGTVLSDIEVQENLLVEPGTTDKSNRLMSSEGLEATEEDLEAFEAGEEEAVFGQQVMAYLRARVGIPKF